MHQLSASACQFRIDPFSSHSVVGRVINDSANVLSGVSAMDAEALLIAVGNLHDERAFNELFQRFSGKTFALGMKYMRNEQLARDLVQEAMLAIWQKAPLYNLDKGSAQTWIFTLVRNRCFDMLRKRKRQPDTIAADDIWPLEDAVEFSENPEQRQDAEIGMRQMERHYRELPELQREAIEEIFFNDLTHQEAAIKLEIPLGTLKSRLRLGLIRLRQLIGVEQ